MHEVECAGSMLARETMKRCRKRSEHGSMRLGRPVLIADSGASPIFASRPAPTINHVYTETPKHVEPVARKPNLHLTSSQKIAKGQVANARFPCGKTNSTTTIQILAKAETLTSTDQVKIATVTVGAKITVIVDTSQTPPTLLSVQ